MISAAAFYRTVRPAFFLLDPESAHGLALKAVRAHDDKMTRALSDTQRAAMVDALARIEAAGGEGGDPA
mgnify:CR=1 FL=1